MQRFFTFLLIALFAAGFTFIGCSKPAEPETDKQDTAETGDAEAGAAEAGDAEAGAAEAGDAEAGAAEAGDTEEGSGE